MYNFQADIKKFNEMYGLPYYEFPTLRAYPSPAALATRLGMFKKILLKEIDEVDDIIRGLNACPSETEAHKIFADIADWLGDIQVYCASEAARMGLDNAVVLQIIMQSNFTKLGADGRPIVRDGKVQKGPNFVPPEGKLLDYVSGPTPASKHAPTNEAYVPQVGGNHYQQKDGKPQHWDLSIMYGWDPFQYQITKYVMRWKDKHHTPEKKLEDLKKARTFLDKYIISYREFLPVEPAPPSPATKDEFKKYEEDSATYLSNEDFLCEGGWGSGLNLYTCKKCRGLVRAGGLQGAAQAHACQGTAGASAPLQGPV